MEKETETMFKLSLKHLRNVFKIFLRSLLGSLLTEANWFSFLFPASDILSQSTYSVKMKCPRHFPSFGHNGFFLKRDALEQKIPDLSRI